MEWHATQLQQIAVDLQPGFACQPVDKGSGVPQLRTNNVSPNGAIDLSEVKHVPATKSQLKRYLLAKGDVLFNNTNSPALVGKTALFAEDDSYLFSNHMTRVRVDRRVAVPGYVARYLHWSWTQGTFRSLVTQWVNQAAINRTQLGSITIPLPPLSEQRRIVEILDQADHLRRLRTEADTKADRILPALLARTLGSPRSWAGSPHCRPLATLVDPVSGATPSKRTERFWDGEVPWVSPKDMKRDYLSDSQDHVSEAALSETNLSLIDEGAALIVVRGMILARDIPVAINLRPVTINQDMKALVPRTNEVTGSYVWAALYLAKPVLNALVRTAGHGTRKLDTPDLLQFEIPEPSPDKLYSVASIVDHHRLSIEQRQASEHLLERLFSVVLAKAFDTTLTRSWRATHMNELLQEMEEQEKTFGEPAT